MCRANPPPLRTCCSQQSSQCSLYLASSPGPSQILSRSREEKSGEGLGAKLRHGPEMVDSVSTNHVAAPNVLLAQLLWHPMCYWPSRCGTRCGTGPAVAAPDVVLAQLLRHPMCYWPSRCGTQCATGPAIAAPNVLLAQPLRHLICCLASCLDTTRWPS